MWKHKCKRYKVLIISVAALMLCMTGCGNKKSKGSVETNKDNQQTTAAVRTSGEITMSYNQIVKVVVKKIDTKAEVIQLKNTAGGVEYTLTYSSGTAVWDKYGNSKLPEEIKEGDIVEAYFDDTQSVLAGICYSSQDWEFQGSENWKFNSERQELNIGKEKYYFSDDLLILSEGKEINIMDLNESDILNIQGCGKKVLSVTVERGHGYVKLEGIEDFIGGWVEIGKVIKPISEDMLIVVPEGNWDVTVVKDGYGGSIATVVARNEESTVNFTGVAAEIVRYGAVEFTIEPEDAILYIAGREVDYSSQILLEYDTYKIRASAGGYEDYTGELKVEKALMGYKITLEKEADSEETEEATSASPSPSPSSSADTASAKPKASESQAEEKNTQAPTATPSDNTNESNETGEEDSDDVEAIMGYTIEIKSPTGVNVYFDDAYVGVSPVSFTKISGDHTITFSKEGYVTKSYSVEIGKEEKDVTFELPDLEHEK